MKDMNRLFVILACVARLVLVPACVVTGPAYAGAKPAAKNNRADDTPTVFISATPAKPSLVSPRREPARKKPASARPARAPTAAAKPPVLPRHAFTGAFNLPAPAPHAGGHRPTLLTMAEPTPVAEQLSVQPRLLFDAHRSALPGSWLQVDPANQVPLMRQAVGVDSEYIRRQIGVEVGYSASGAAEKSRFLFDVRTNSLDQETVRAAVGIPLN